MYREVSAFYWMCEVIFWWKFLAWAQQEYHPLMHPCRVKPQADTLHTMIRCSHSTLVIKYFRRFWQTVRFWQDLGCLFSSGSGWRHVLNRPSKDSDRLSSNSCLKALREQRAASNSSAADSANVLLCEALLNAKASMATCSQWQC